MKRIALLSGAFASVVGLAAGSVFADIAVGPNPSDFIPATSGDAATAIIIVGVPVAVLVVAAIVLLWYLRHQKAAIVSAVPGAGKAVGGAAPKKK